MLLLLHLKKIRFADPFLKPLFVAEKEKKEEEEEENKKNRLVSSNINYTRPKSVIEEENNPKL